MKWEKCRLRCYVRYFSADGEIGFDDLKLALLDVGEDIDDQEISDMINEARIGHGQSIKFTDFLRIVEDCAQDVVQLTDDYVRNKI